MADCLCGHAIRDHKSAMANGRVVPYCVRCKACNGFGIINPPYPRALLVDEEPHAGTAEASTTPWVGTPPVKETLLYAWNTRWCPTCGSRYFAEDAECCGQPCVPVRLEMHSREPG